MDEEEELMAELFSEDYVEEYPEDHAEDYYVPYDYMMEDVFIYIETPDGIRQIGCFFYRFRKYLKLNFREKIMYWLIGLQVSFG